MAFNPTLETNVQPISPVQRSSPMQGIASLFDTFMGGPAPQAPSQTDVKAQDSQSYFSEMDMANQLRAQGRTAEADQRAASAWRGLASKYGPEAIPGAAELYGNYSGMDPLQSLTGKTNLNDSLRSNPEFAKQLALVEMSNPELDEGAKDAEALRYTANVVANEAKLSGIKQGEAVSWVEAKPVYDEGVRLAREDLQRMVTNFSKDNIITPEESQEIRSYWGELLTSKFQAPPGVPIEEWDKYKKTYIDPLQEVINVGVGINDFLGKDMSEDMPRALNQIVNVLIADGKLPPALRINLAPDATGDMMSALKTALEMYQADNGSGAWADKISSVMKMDYDQLLHFAQNFETADASWVDSIDASPILESDGPGKEGTLLQDKARALSENPGAAAEGIISLVEHAAALDGNTVFAGGFMKSMFDEVFFNKVAELNTINPTAGAAIIERVDLMLDTRLAAAKSNIESIATQNGFKLTSNGMGKYNLELTPSLLSPEAKMELDTYFGGSVAAASAAQGRRTTVTSPTGYAFSGIPISLTPSLEQNFKELAKMNDELDAYASVLNMRNRVFGEVETAMPEETSVAPTGMEFKLPEEVAKDTAFVAALQSVAQNNGVSSDDLARIIAFESANTWSPSVKNPGSSATGLIQFMGATAKSLGTTTAELAAMTRDQQMVYVDKYLQQYKGKIKNLGDLYMAVHWPAGIGKDEAYVMYREGSAEYAGNKNLDTNGDGTVTRGEAIQRVITATPGNGAMLYMPSNAGVSAAVGPNQSFNQPSSGPDPVSVMTTAPAMPSAPAPLGKGAVTVEPGQTTDGGSLISGLKGKPTAQTNKEIQDYLNSLVGQEGGIKNYDTEEALSAAISSGEVSKGDVVAVGGEVRIVK